MNLFFYRQRQTIFLGTIAAAILLCGATGCSKQAQNTSPEQKKAFLGDASQMPESVKQQNAKMAQQSALRAQQASQQAQRQAPPPK